MKKLHQLIIGLIFLVIMALCTGNAGAVEFKLGEFNISMNTPEIDHISYTSDAYDEFEGNTASFSTLFLSYKVSITKPLSVSVEDCKSIPVAGHYDSLLDVEIDGKPATMILANQYTTIEYVKDDKALITLQFKEAEGTDSSKAINEAIKSFNATRI